ncbi:hypothetical protein NQ318_002561 [Aromia moschata]|uniref:Uncharacterized protein n=1 Tax=Aromia moschata TaxID=1265417 RepID=A0AAV8X519_9CUCU|nr:hypothetical protein NQ318_002561 [Aromia moschata]
MLIVITFIFTSASASQLQDNLEAEPPNHLHPNSLVLVMSLSNALSPVRQPMKNSIIQLTFASDLDTAQRILLQNFNTPTETVFFQEFSFFGGLRHSQKEESQLNHAAEDLHLQESMKMSIEYRILKIEILESKRKFVFFTSPSLSLWLKKSKILGKVFGNFTVARAGGKRCQATMFITIVAP